MSKIARRLANMAGPVSLRSPDGSQIAPDRSPLPAPLEEFVQRADRAGMRLKAMRERGIIPARRADFQPSSGSDADLMWSLAVQLGDVAETIRIETLLALGSYLLDRCDEFCAECEKGSEVVQ